VETGRYEASSQTALLAHPLALYARTSVPSHSSSGTVVAVTMIVIIHFGRFTY
jgi:hypothetical protein